MSIFFLRFSLLLFLWAIKESSEIQNVKLIFPTIVRAGTSATLLCLYDLEGASLYAVQWYRGQFEFFRFVPKENPQIKVFQVPGLYVDIFASSEHQVTLKNIPLQISGEFSCEVTTDYPKFSTSCVSENLKVIDFSLSLEVSKRQYCFGDIIHATCRLLPKVSSTKFIFQWNSKLVPDQYYFNQSQEYSQLRLNTSIFDTGQINPTIIHLKCSAILTELYHIESKSIPLEFKSYGSVKESKAAHLNSGIYFIYVIFLKKYVFGL